MKQMVFPNISFLMMLMFHHYSQLFISVFKLHTIHSMKSSMQHIDLFYRPKILSSSKANTHQALAVNIQHRVLFGLWQLSWKDLC